MRMIERGGSLGLGDEALAARLVPGEIWRQQFERNAPVEQGVIRQIDFPHAARPQLAD